FQIAPFQPAGFAVPKTSCSIGNFARICQHGESIPFGPPVNRLKSNGAPQASQIRLRRVILMRTSPPGEILMTPQGPGGPLGSSGRISANSNSMWGFGASVTRGGVAFSTTKTGVATLVRATFKPSCFSNASNRVTTSLGTGAQLLARRGDHVRLKFHAP